MRILKYFIVLIFLALMVGIYYKNFNLFANSRVPPVPYSNFFNKPSLEDVVKKGLEETTGDYAFFIKNLKTGEEFSLNKDKQFESGSLYKLWVMAAAFEKIKNGELKEDDILTDSVAFLNNKFGLETGFSELPESETISLSVSDALFQMITISHNYSALLLLDKVGSESVANFLSKGEFLNSTIMDSPKTTAYNAALFFEKLYKGEIIDREYSDKMLGILVQQKLNSGIPKYLPGDLKIAHKTGDLGWFKHDGGIIFAGKGDFIIVALSESDFPEGAMEKIAIISRAVYDYFSN